MVNKCFPEIRPMQENEDSQSLSHARQPNKNKSFRIDREEVRSKMT